MRKKNPPDFAISESRSGAWKYHWGFKRWDGSITRKKGVGRSGLDWLLSKWRNLPRAAKNQLCETFEKKAYLARLPEPDLGFGGAGREGGGGLTEETAGGSAASDWVGGGEKL